MKKAMELLQNKERGFITETELKGIQALIDAGELTRDMIQHDLDELFDKIENGTIEVAQAMELQDKLNGMAAVFHSIEYVAHQGSIQSF